MSQPKEVYAQPSLRNGCGYKRRFRMQEILGVTALLLLPATAALAGRPLNVDDAETAPKGEYEFEVGADFSRSDEDHNLEVPFGLTYGAAKNLEVGIGWGAQVAGSHNLFGSSGVRGSQDLVIGAKWNFHANEKRNLHLALAGGVKLPTASTDKALGTGDRDYDIAAILTKTNGRTSIDLNAGYTFAGASKDPSITDSFHYGIAARHATSERLTLVAELFAERAKGERNFFQATGGIQYAVRPNLILDAGVGTGLGSINDERVFKIGLTRAF